MVRKAFENNPTLKIMELTKKKISVAIVSRAVTNEGEKSLRLLKKPLLSEAMLQKHCE